MNGKTHYVLYGAIGAAALAACVSFLQRWDVLFYVAIAALFYGGVWAISHIASLEKESHARLLEAESLRELMRERQGSPLERAHSLFS